MSRLQKELDSVEREIQQMTPGTGEYQSELKPNFYKYGYSNRVRTHNALDRNYGFGEEESSPSTLKFYQRPLLRQYFHKGLLWRSPKEHEVTSYELFVDLLYAGIIAVNGGTASHHPDGASLLRFCVTFLPSWRIWSDISLNVSWFDSGTSSRPSL
jgi:hypothetical protein